MAKKYKTLLAFYLLGSVFIFCFLALFPYSSEKKSGCARCCASLYGKMRGKKARDKEADAIHG